VFKGIPPQHYTQLIQYQNKRWRDIFVNTSFMFKALIFPFVNLYLHVRMCKFFFSLCYGRVIVFIWSLCLNLSISEFFLYIKCRILKLVGILVFIIELCIDNEIR